jgi:hypothetical protein
MNIRAACLSVALVFGFSALPVQAQGPGQPPPNYNQLINQIADLQARVAKLEGTISPSDLAGTYSLLVLSTTMTAFRAGPPFVPATINTAAFRATLALNANGTGSMSASACEGSTLTQGAWAMQGFDCSEPDTDVTWVYTAGVITITFLSDGDEIPLVVAVGGRLLISAYAPFHPSDPSSDQLLIVATRLK